MPVTFPGPDVYNLGFGEGIHLFCPSCGVKNEGNPLKCFICGYILPTGERSSNEPRRRRQPTLSTTEPLAAIGDRMLALILDRVLLVAILAIPAAAMAERWKTTAPVRIIVIGSLALAILALTYHIVLESLFGATLGKGLLGLEVRNGSRGSRWLSMTIRNITRLLDSMFFYALAFLVAAFSSRRQRLGDHFAGTTVCEKPVAWGARVALIFIWVVLVAGSLWFAGWLCPSCLPDPHRFAF
ncbi:MAG: RDD family protein [Thermoanaerobaculia bacterium]